MTGNYRSFASKVLIVIALVGGTVVLWQLQAVLLLIFAAIVIAIVLHAIADGLCKLLAMPRGLALLIGGLLVALVIVGAGFMFGSEVGAQINQVEDSLPVALQTVADLIGRDTIDGLIEDFAPDNTTIASLAEYAFSALTGALSGLVVAILGGLYIATNPRTYRKGAIKLLPKRAQNKVDTASKRTGKALKDWLLAQLISMIATAVVVYVGLTLIGVPSALALAILAGLFEFVPLVGPFLGAIPAVLVALISGLDTALWTIGFFIVWQQIEGNAVAPLAMRYAVEIPPAVTLFCLLIFGTLFGLPGLLLGGPLTVVVWMWVRTLWLNEDDFSGKEDQTAGSSQ